MNVMRAGLWPILVGARRPENLPTLVMAGLDPAIHRLRKNLFEKPCKGFLQR
jgi:hypothetical protein